MNWYELSQRNFGLILTGKRPAQGYVDTDFHPPFDVPVKYMLENPSWTKEDIYIKFSPTIEWDTALHSIASMNGSATAVEWSRDLSKLRSMWQIGEDMKKKGHKMQAGEEPDVLHLVSDLRMMSINEETGLQNAATVNLDNIRDLQKCGWKAIDDTFGGIPASGPLVVFGPTKTGKTFWTSQLIDKFLHYYPEKTAAIFSLEMGGPRYLKRSFEMYPTLHEVKDRIWISGKARGMPDIVAETATRECDIVVIDSVDYALNAEASSAGFDRVWKSIVQMGRLLDIPVVAVAQPNREGKFKAKTEFLGPYSIEWSGAAENASEQLIALQHIEHSIDMTDKQFPLFDDAYYMISWFQRGGYPQQKGPGAIIMRNEDNKSGKLWDGEVYQNMLWRPDKYKKAVERTSSRRKVEDD